MRCRARPRCRTDRQCCDETRAGQFQKTAAVILPADQLVAGNQRLELSDSGARIVGASIGGTLVALKGDRAQSELEAEEPVLKRLGMTAAHVRSYGDGLLDVPTVTLELTAAAVARRSGATRGASKGPRDRANRGSNRR